MNTLTASGTATIYNIPPTQGEAYISLKRNRSKFYPGNQVFLQDKQEFEIELFNPTQNTKLAKISINGKFISNAGIVLKPGQRVYLERYIDTPQKFKFETYTIDASDSQSVAAAANNGDIIVYFYDEYIPQNYTYTSNYPFTLNYNNSAGTGISATCTSSYSGASGGQQVNSLRSANLDGQRKSFMSQSKPELKSRRSSGIGGQSMDSGSMDWMEQEKERGAEVETGRVEKGNYSNQRFTNYSGQFNTWATNTVVIKLLPFSQKPVEINELAQYCVECGSKNKGGKYKFCPSCGTKF